MDIITQLIAGLSTIPESIVLTPVRGDKSPYRSNWQSEEPASREVIKKDIKSGFAKGYGIRTGEISGGIVAVDCDGVAAHDLAKKFGGLPETVSFTSGKPGRCQYLYQIPQEYWKKITTRKINTQVKDSDGKLVHLELRWNGCQSVLPPSAHPETGRYQWVNSFENTKIATAPDWIIEKMQSDFSGTKGTNSNPKSAGETNNNWVPLYVCLSKGDRQLIDSGVGEGGRNNAGAKLARNLVGTARRLEYLGYRVEDKPEDLFEQYCDRCSPPIDKRERATIWQSAMKDNPTSSLSDEMLENCIKAWQRGKDLSSSETKERKQTSSTNKQWVANGSSAMKSNSAPTRLSKEEQIQRSRKILQFPLPESRLTTEINQLSKEADLSPYETRKLVAAVEWETEFDADLQDSRRSFQDLIAPTEISLEEIFPKRLAKALITKAESDRVDPNRIIQTILPIAGILMGGKISIMAKEGAHYKDSWIECPIFFTAEVATSSTGKSANQRMLTEPIREMQKQEFERVAEAKRELQKKTEDWKALSADEKREKFDTTDNPVIFEETYCKPRRYIFDQITSQALTKKIAQQPSLSGSCWMRDELYATFQSLDQFTGGRGEARQFLLSAWNGPLWGTVDRVDDANSYQFKGQCLNIAGGIQPLVAPKIWNTSLDPDGLLSRFLPAIAQIPDNFAQWSDVRVDVYETVTHYLGVLEELKPTLLKYSEEAHRQFIQYWEVLRKGFLKYREDNPAYSQFLGKQCSYVSRFALVIHVLDCIERGIAIDSPVNLDTIKKAIKLSLFYCHQLRLIQASSCVASPDATLDHILYLVYECAKSKGGTVTTRDISNRCRKFQKMTYQGKKITAAVALKMFEAIASAGLGRVEGKRLILNSLSNGRVKTVKMTQTDTENDTPSNPGGSEVSPDFDTNDTVTRIPSKNLGSPQEQATVPGESPEHPQANNKDVPNRKHPLVKTSTTTEKPSGSDTSPGPREELTASDKNQQGNRVTVSPVSKSLETPPVMDSGCVKTVSKPVSVTQNDSELESDEKHTEDAAPPGNSDDAPEQVNQQDATTDASKIGENQQRMPTAFTVSPVSNSVSSSPDNGSGRVKTVSNSVSLTQPEASVSQNDTEDAVNAENSDNSTPRDEANTDKPMPTGTGDANRSQNPRATAGERVESRNISQDVASELVENVEDTVMDLINRFRRENPMIFMQTLAELVSEYGYPRLLERMTTEQLQTFWELLQRAFSDSDS